MSGKLRTFSICALLAGSPAAHAGGFATEVIEYVQGGGLDPSDASYNNPATVLGSPERFSGELTPFPSVVSAFSPPFWTDELVSLGEGGSITVRFDQPIVDDPSHLYGVDFMVFGNAGFILGDFLNLTASTPAAFFGPGNGKVEVSADGLTFYEIPNAIADQLFPTQGYLDGGPFDGVPGSVPTDFFKPVNPALSLSDFDGKSYAQILALYDGSGGGLPLDLAAAVDGFGAPAGLTSASYVRVSQMGAGDTQIEAFVAVPEPAAWLLGLGTAVMACRRGRNGKGC